jgi:hypothetical protein
MHSSEHRLEVGCTAVLKPILCMVRLLSSLRITKDSWTTHTQAHGAGGGTMLAGGRSRFGSRGRGHSHADQRTHGWQQPDAHCWDHARGCVAVVSAQLQVPLPQPPAGCAGSVWVVAVFAAPRRNSPAGSGITVWSARRRKSWATPFASPSHASGLVAVPGSQASPALRPSSGITRRDTCGHGRCVCALWQVVNGTRPYCQRDSEHTTLTTRCCHNATRLQLCTAGALCGYTHHLSSWALLPRYVREMHRAMFMCVLFLLLRMDCTFSQL